MVCGELSLWFRVNWNHVSAKIKSQEGKGGWWRDGGGRREKWRLSSQNCPHDIHAKSILYFNNKLKNHKVTFISSVECECWFRSLKTLAVGSVPLRYCIQSRGHVTFLTVQKLSQTRPVQELHIKYHGSGLAQEQNKHCREKPLHGRRWEQEAGWSQILRVTCTISFTKQFKIHF